MIPTKYGPASQMPVRLDRREHRGHGCDRDEERDPALRRYILEVGLRADHGGHERDRRYQDRQPAPVETRMWRRRDGVDDEHTQVHEAERAQDGRLERRGRAEPTLGVRP